MATTGTSRLRNQSASCSTCAHPALHIAHEPLASASPPTAFSVGAGRRSKKLTRVLSATAAGQQLKVPDDQPAQINNELPGTKGSRAAPTYPNFHRCRRPAGEAKLTTRVGARSPAV